MDVAAKLGFLSVDRFLHTNGLKGCGEFAIDRAAKYGHLHVVQWLHENHKEGCPFKAMMRASWNGHLEMVRYLREVVQRGAGPINYHAWTQAMSRGHMPVVQYLLDQMSTSLRNETLAAHPEWISDAVDEAVQMKVVKWIQDSPPLDITRANWLKQLC